MMTREEAVKSIKDNYPTSGYYILREALDMAIEALEKQIPKKPNKFIGDLRDYDICPHCNFALPQGTEFCQSCGQSIDWSEVE